MSANLLIRSAEVNGVAGLDVRIRCGMISEIGPNLQGPEPQLYAGGGALLPGLIDHHIHLMALASEHSSLRLGPDDVANFWALRTVLQNADRQAPPGVWLRGTGYHEAVAGSLDRYVLDYLVPTRPVRIQHRTGGLWVLNSAALAAVGAAEADVDGIERDASGTPTGHIWRADAWLRRRLPKLPLSLGSVARQLAAFGVTGVTDASVTNDAGQAALFAAARVTGDLPQRLMLMSSGALPTSPAYRVGPVKILLDDDGLDDLEAVITSIAQARIDRRAVAVHCVTAVQLAFALAAFKTAGARPGDRIEHGSMIDSAAVAEIAQLGLCVVTQPGFIAERGDQYRSDITVKELPNLYRCASLLGAGILVGGSSDAPYTRPDPWAAMAAAMKRATPSGAVLGKLEAVDGETALRLFLGTFDAPGGPPRQVTTSAPADLCLLNMPFASAVTAPSSTLVHSTIIDGVIVHSKV